MKYTYDYARPSVSADNALFGFEDGQLKLLLIERGGMSVLLLKLMVISEYCIG